MAWDFWKTCFLMLSAIKDNKKLTQIYRKRVWSVNFINTLSVFYEKFHFFIKKICKISEKRDLYN